MRNYQSREHSLAYWFAKIYIECLPCTGHWTRHGGLNIDSHSILSRGLHTGRDIHLKDMHGISGHNSFLPGIGPKCDSFRTDNKLAQVVVTVF